jgi:hypothetical protein
MLDRLFAHPAVLVASLILLVILVGSYLLNRERAEIQRRRGPKRFRPDWSRTQAGDYRKKPGYRRRTGGGFKPQWPDRKRDGEKGPGNP